MDTLGKRQNDLYVDLDQRLAELNKSLNAPAVAPAVVTAKPPPAEVANPAPVSASKASKEEPVQTATTEVSQPSPSSAPAAVAKSQPVQSAPQLDPLLESRAYEAA
jgi:hypothetical protein